MKLISGDVVARGDQFVVHTGHVAADPGHLGGDVDCTLLQLRLQLCSLMEQKQTEKRFHKSDKVSFIHLLL